jgi:hypothetical protein
MAKRVFVKRSPNASFEDLQSRLKQDNVPFQFLKDINAGVEYVEADIDPAYANLVGGSTGMAVGKVKRTGMWDF